MIDTHALVALTLISIAGVMSPGPNFVVVAQRALLHGRRDAMITAAGVLTVSAIWASASLFGLAVVFKLFPWLHMTLKIVGAAYLLWIGFKLWRDARKPMPVVTAEGRAGAGGWRAFRAGLATNLSNAKAIAFYTSVFSAAAPSPEKTATLWVALVLVLAIGCIWYSVVVFAFTTGPVAAGYRRAKTTIERACGALMIAFGVQLAVSR
ncbi:LysE family transporter [Sphingomonas sp. AOB5]|uniref:LysE family translocator n=1 Tax=Sphingomonas sp. AOB5 TaxID=3034017 RepID=UPI0023F9AF51|nr:LysE family transporter [Sphingomonas sp. AOB5]MDF7774388.1 LysE family transporter [Sphingomonas sp. AOB5]